ncbi:DUF3304 domain-containing protein [Bordetella genomosp. 5]|uniref:DUF3304 domain-containing protein n=1 Tax=Bordetella genomosp. 5 TaxID=1395608 RepID=A0A261TWY4_9BORD|nr:DUF3304 domain-containing protein [Bordetella genomosp. 5]OZI54208.1 hypothetical protein CAL25_05355 [Bordetella genomosp. 5]
MAGRRRFTALVCALAVLMTGCAGSGANSASQGKPKRKYLTLAAFNYTDRSLLDVTVDKIWMGNAGAYTTGGLAMGPPVWKESDFRFGATRHVVVRWREGSRYDLKTNRYISDGQKPVPREALAEVAIPKPFPPNPALLLLHFYPDGRVEGELVDRSVNQFDRRRISMPPEHEYARRWPDSAKGLDQR